MSPDQSALERLERVHQPLLDDDECEVNIATPPKMDDSVEKLDQIKTKCGTDQEDPQALQIQKTVLRSMLREIKQRSSIQAGSAWLSEREDGSFKASLKFLGPILESTGEYKDSQFEQMGILLSKSDTCDLYQMIMELYSDDSID